MVTDAVPVCLRYGIFEMGIKDLIIDRRECIVCSGERCPYETDGMYNSACPRCFGTGVTNIDAELLVFDGADSVCPLCGGAGVLLGKSLLDQAAQAQ